MTQSPTIPLAFYPPDSRFQIRPVNLNDVFHLHQCCWTFRTREQVEAHMNRVNHLREQSRGGGVIVPGDAQNPITGYGQLTRWAKCVEISDLIVSPQYRGQGIGTSLIQYLVQMGREMQVECVEIGVALSNPRALALYRRLGFHDSYQLALDVGNGSEPVLYLRLAYEQNIG